MPKTSFERFIEKADDLYQVPTTVDKINEANTGTSPHLSEEAMSTLVCLSSLLISEESIE